MMGFVQTFFMPNKNTHSSLAFHCGNIYKQQSGEQGIIHQQALSNLSLYFVYDE